MTTILVSDNEFYDPEGTIPFLEKDPAIIRSVTKALLDFSNQDTYVGSGAIASGTKFKSLTSGGEEATAGTAFAGVTGGMLEIDEAVLAPFVTLPDTFKLPSTTRRFVAILWVKLPNSGWQTTSTNINNALIGYMNNSSTLAQWGIGVTTVQATGAINGLVAFLPLNSTSANGVGLTNADTLTHVADGELHQIAIYWDAETSGTTHTRKIFVDKVERSSSLAGPWSGNINTPSANVRLGTSNAFQTTYADGVFLGRPSIHNLTGTGVFPESVIAADWDAAQGYLS